MNDINRINEFLKYMAIIAKNNYELTTRMVYGNLIYMGVRNKRDSISSNFNDWINYFRNIDNINVFVSPTWKYFCQFKNLKSNYVDSYSMIKLYIPLDKEHINLGAKKLFDYMAQENVCHQSKIGSAVRFDDVVIRVSSSKDADKIINFIQNDEYFSEGLLPTNPFALSSNNVSVSWDGTLSYNMVVSNWISEYINYEKENNNLDNVGYARFFAYIKEKSNDLFNKGIGLDELFDKLVDDKIFDVCDGTECQLLNYKDVTNLLLDNLDLDKKMTKEDIYDYVSKISSSKYQDEQVDLIGELKDGKQNLESDFSPQQKASFKLAFDYMCERYGYETAKKQFINYLNTGDVYLITRYKGARELFTSNNLTKDVAFRIVLDWKKEALDNAMVTTYDKYGYMQLSSAIIALINFNDFSHFTNDQNARKDLKARFSDDSVIDTIKSILKSEGYTTDISNEEIVDLILENFLNKNNKNRSRM